MTIAFIVVLGPLILGTATDSTGSLIGGFGDTGESVTAVASVMALMAGIMSITMGIIGRVPLAIGIPAFLTIVLMPFTFSIVNGVGAGFVAWVVIKTFQRKARGIPLVM